MSAAEFAVRGGLFGVSAGQFDVRPLEFGVSIVLFAMRDTEFGVRPEVFDVSGGEFNAQNLLKMSRLRVLPPKPAENTPKPASARRRRLLNAPDVMKACAEFRRRLR